MRRSPARFSAHSDQDLSVVDLHQAAYWVPERAKLVLYEYSTSLYNSGMRLLLALALVAVLQRPGEPELRIPDLERRVHDLINKERKKNKAGALQFDERLSKIARAHSADMAKRKFFGHVNPEGQNATERGKRAGYICQKVYGGYFTDGLLENIYQGSLYSRIRITGNQTSYDWYSPEEIAEEAVEGWMGSAGHRRNILEKNHERAGIGIAVDSDDKVYLTQVFC